MTVNEKANNIAANLAKMGLEDPTVIGKINIKKEAYGTVVRVVETDPMKLSELCGRATDIRYKGIEVDKAGGEIVDLNIHVFMDAVEIGYVDSDAQFNFKAARNLRDCVGWAVATDLGQERVLSYDLDVQVEALGRSIRMAPPLEAEFADVLKDFFFSGAFAQEVMKTMQYQVASRFGDGYCGVKTLFWRVGTRTLRGQEHEGFSFCY